VDGEEVLRDDEFVFGDQVFGGMVMLSIIYIILTNWKNIKT
jgi:hypothetical protein